MTDIDKAANDYITVFNAITQSERFQKYSKDSAEIGFKAGVKWSQLWVAVEKDLPSDKRPVLTKSTKDKNIDYRVSVYNHKTKKWVTTDLCNYQDYEPTHWRYIEFE
jgi:hypothetical protein